MTRLCFFLLVLIVMISCNVEDRESFMSDDIEAEVIDMNWYSTVKDFYVPEIMELESARGLRVDQNSRDKKQSAFIRSK